MNNEIETLEEIGVDTKAADAKTGVSKWTLDGSHSVAGFRVKHMMVANVRGEFREMTGTLTYDAGNVAKSSIEVTIQTASIHTRDEKRDEHLKSADFFDVAKFGEITFRSTSFAKAGNGKLTVKGNLTMHGVTKEVTLDVEGPTPEQNDPWGGRRMGFEATTKLNRKDFGLTWNVALEAGGVIVGDEIQIALEAEFVKA